MTADPKIGRFANEIAQAQRPVRAKPAIGWVPLVFGATVLSALAFGWSERNEYWYSAEYGLGYAFGITGLSMMLLLLLYPARKRWRPLSQWFPVRYWFRAHMVLGVLGPVFILFHANFSLGSTNSNVALFSMLLVATSGLVGRYVYSQIHRGLYGEAIAYQDLVREFHASGATEGTALEGFKRALDLDQGSVVRLLFHQRAISRQARTSEEAGMTQAWLVLGRMARLRVFSRLFSLWHVFHLPFFVMMCVTAVVHVVVVHMY